MKSINRPKINPLSRVPRQQRLIMAVRGGAGVAKAISSAQCRKRA
jgi:hypothetical protein